MVLGVVGFGVFASVMERGVWSCGIVVVRWRDKAGMEIDVCSESLGVARWSGL
jgi:hypothetical protein